MPLSPPAERELKHRRDIRLEGYERSDGLWDIEAVMTDRKSYGFDNAYRGRIEAGDFIHEMHLRMTLDEEMVVQSLEAVTENGPYATCPQAAPNFARMAGVKVGPGWTRAIRERVGGVEGCTHLRETLQAMATVAFQTLYPALARKRAAEALKSGAPKPGKPMLLNTCHAYRDDGPVARELWPDYAVPPEKTS